MTDQPSRICVTRAHPANDGVIDLTDITNEISIEIDGKTITCSYEVNRGMIMVSGGILGKKSTPLGGTTELLARRVLRELYAESRRPQII